MQDEGAGPIALVGGEEFQEAAVAFDRLLLSAVARIPASVAIVPTAAAGENPQAAATHGVKHFEQLGARPYEVMIVDAESANDERLVDELRRAEIVYFSGGNPKHLLESMRGSAAWACLEERSRRGTVLAGSSAGAMVMGERMRYAGEDVDGLGLVRGVVVLPHFERSAEDRVERLRSGMSAGLTLLGIDGATGCLLQGGRWRVDGPGNVSVITKSNVEVVPAGGSFTLP